jgi:molecular chaperone Hsp33
MTASLLTRIFNVLLILELMSTWGSGFKRLHLIQRSINAVSLTRHHYSRIPLMPEAEPALEIDDNILTGLNSAQDLTIKVCSCTKVLQEFINRSKIPDITAMALGELIASTTMLSSSLKDEETMQINFVGTQGLKNILVVADSNLKVRGLVGNAQFLPQIDFTGNGKMNSLFGSPAQIQVVRNHPTYKNPMNGIVAMQEASISTNIALYLAQSEQRTAAIIANILVEDGKAKHALAVMMERLPGAADENIELGIQNLHAINDRGLASYLQPTTNNNPQDILDLILDDSLKGMDSGSIRWFPKNPPKFSCSCSSERVIRALKLLPVDELQVMVEEDKGAECKCEFCGEEYKVTTDELRSMMNQLM